MAPSHPSGGCSRPRPRPAPRTSRLGAGRALLALLLHCAPLAALLLAAAPARAYVPAVPTNDTAAAQAAGLNLSDTSTLNVLFYPAGNFTTRVSYQLVGADSSGISQVRHPRRPSVRPFLPPARPPVPPARLIARRPAAAPSRRP